IAARLGHRRQWANLCRAARRLRRGRSALRARPVVPLSDGAARATGGLRAGGELVREGDADERGRIQAQGAHVRTLLGDCRRGEDAASATAALLRRGALTPPLALCEWCAAPDSPRYERRAARARNSLRRNTRAAV